MCKRQMSLEVVLGPMFSGKSSYIHHLVHRYKALDIPILVIKPDIDKRYTKDACLVTHDQLKVPCVMWDTHTMLQKLRMDVPDKLVIIEEAQFFRGLVEFVKHLVDEERRDVVIVGLDGDWRRKPFPEILDCIPLADKVTKLHALCKRCRDGTPGLFTHRLSNDTAQVSVGGPEAYEPLCRSCFLTATGGSARD